MLSLLVLLLCLCKSFKELFLFYLQPVFRAKADAKVRLFSVPSKFLGNYFSKKRKIFAFYDKINNTEVLFE